jgi:uncharacterized protein YceH (UPF0502 family)
MDLSNSEIRVLGCLLEKQRTTPDHYPLSLNSLRLACNQATNREPVVEYDETVVRDALHRLGRRGYVRLAGASRAAKYRHLLSEAMPMSDAEHAAMCVLMLRGAQTPGELKQRGERIHAFDGLDEVHATLAALIERDLVARLGRRPGQKEERYAQRLGEDAEPDAPPASTSAPASQDSHRDAPGPASAPARPDDHRDAAGPASAPARPDDHRDAAGPASAPAGPDGHRDAPTAPVASAPGLLERIECLEREVIELRAILARLGDRQRQPTDEPGFEGGDGRAGEQRETHDDESSWGSGVVQPTQ